MGQKPINPRGGVAYIVAASLPDEHFAMLDELARLTGKSRSAVARELIVEALAETKQEALAPP